MTDLRVVTALLRGQPRNGSHAERLERFYAPQADAYDRFRARLLHGREEMIARLAPSPGASVAEFGAGTGATAALFGARIARLSRLDLIDLCPSLAARARTRFRDDPAVRVFECDVLEYTPEAQLDAVYFSYSLTMIPDWRAALERALELLAPGGQIGVVDFIAPRTGPGRHLWPRWFAHDGVRLNRAHLDLLRERTLCVYATEQRSPLPYLPFMHAPWYLYIGRTRGAARTA